MKKIQIIILLLLVAFNPANAASSEGNPALNIPTIDGKIFNLKEKRGKVVIVNFWANWCIDCRKEMMVLDEIYQKYKSQNLEIIGISIDRKSQRKKVLEISSKVSYANAMFFEAKEISFEESNSIPVSYLIDKNGKLVTKIIGFEDVELMKKNFENVVKPLI